MNGVITFPEDQINVVELTEVEKQRKKWTEEQVKKVQGDWMTVKCPKPRNKRTYPFGQFRTNVYDHAWTTQFKEISRNDVGYETDTDLDESTVSKEYWEDEIIPLFKEENPTWKSDVEVHNRLLELVKISKRYN